ncbi:hypothetical protein E6O75_ATG01531 [Venturia nashicola]|uniref:Uncharacterized protein n=1 Tax=Venturia nashicola TaxID=86259 RepID=A0A4Z1PCD7_9PEZI|nr:hypothetical protein E6O75_ATG01531 [Venturia nashicola]
MHLNRPGLAGIVIGDAGKDEDDDEDMDPSLSQEVETGRELYMDMRCTPRRVADAAHSDAVHSDAAHSDAAHSDAAHSDAVHSEEGSRGWPRRDAMRPTRHAGQIEEQALLVFGTKAEVVDSRSMRKGGYGMRCKVGCRVEGAWSMEQ